MQASARRASGRVIWKPLSFSRPEKFRLATGICRVARLDEGLAQQVDVVGGAAAAAGLGDEQGGVLQVVFAAVQSVQKLADDQQRRVAGVVVDILQAQLGHVRCRSCPGSRICSHRIPAHTSAAGTGSMAILGMRMVWVFFISGVNLGYLVFHHGSSYVTSDLRRAHPAPQTGCAGGCSPRPDW